MAKSSRAMRLSFGMNPDDVKKGEDDPLVAAVLGVDFAPYQSWAEATLGYRFSDPSLLVTALTHRSYVNENRRSTREHNERLEFLGDAVLELVVTDFLFRNYHMPEGVMTSWRAALVRTESIRDAGRELGYVDLVRMSKGEHTGHEQAKLHIVANCFEALIGAIYLDQGLERAHDLIDKYILVNIDDILSEGSWRDAKSYLQEITQRVKGGDTPHYTVIDEDGPDHNKTFTVVVKINGEIRGRGVGSSKQQAQQRAAQQAIERYQKTKGV